MAWQGHSESKAGAERCDWGNARRYRGECAILGSEPLTAVQNARLVQGECGRDEVRLYSPADWLAAVIRTSYR
jgi:hypothetical protein